jgi:hypothetical protein
MLYDTVASPGFLYSQGLSVPLVADEPIGFSESEQPGRRSADPEMARRLATLYGAEWDGVAFHSDAGIQSVPMGPTTRACANAWFDALYRVSAMKKAA